MAHLKGPQRENGTGSPPYSVCTLYRTFVKHQVSMLSGRQEQGTSKSRSPIANSTGFNPSNLPPTAKKSCSTLIIPGPSSHSHRLSNPSARDTYRKSPFSNQGSSTRSNEQTSQQWIVYFSRRSRLPQYREESWKIRANSHLQCRPANILERYMPTS